MSNLKTGVSRKQSTPNFPKNEHLPPDTHTYVFGVLCFLETPVLRFALLPYYRRTNLVKSRHLSDLIPKMPEKCSFKFNCRPMFLFHTS